MDQTMIFLLIMFGSIVCSAGKDIVVAAMFRSTRLRCPMEGEASESVTWRFVKLGTEGEVVVYETSRVVDVFNDTIYANRNKDGRHELFLPNTTSRNAGDYYCLDRGETKILQLIVLESHPMCEPQQTARTLFLSGDNALELSCAVGYWGGSEPPSMQWNILNGPIIPSNNTVISNTSGRSMVKSSIEVTQNSTFVRQSPFNITCTTSFASNKTAEEGVPVKTDKDLGYTHVWYSPEILTDWHEPNLTHGSESDLSTIPGGATHMSRGPSQAGKIDTYRSESSPPDLFQILTTTLLSVICLLLFVVFVAFVMVKCVRVNNHDRQKKKDKMAASSGSDPKQTSYTPLGLELESVTIMDNAVSHLEPVKRMDKSEDHFQRGSSEYYCQIDESLMREIEGDNPVTVTPDSPLGPGYIELHDDELGIASYDQCTSSGPTQVHTYEGRAPTDQEDRDSLEPKVSSYDQLEAAHRSKPPTLPVYRCLETERKELPDDANTKYEQCRSGPNLVHTYEKSREEKEQGEVGGELELKVSKYDQLEPTHKSEPHKPSEYKRLNTNRKETGYIQLLADETDEKSDTSYEQCKTSGPKPEERSGEPGVKVPNYDQLEPAHRSKPPKPPVYRCLDTKLQRRN